MIKWFIANKEWLLSGLGIFILNLLFLLFKKKEKSKYNKYNQISRLQELKIVGNVEQLINQNKNDKPQKKFTLKLALFFGLLTINISWGALFTYKICYHEVQEKLIRKDTNKLDSITNINKQKPIKTDNSVTIISSHSEIDKYQEDSINEFCRTTEQKQYPRKDSDNNDFTANLKAPQIQLFHFSVKETSSSDFNYIIDINEVFDIMLEVENIGNTPAENVTISIENKQKGLIYLGVLNKQYERNKFFKSFESITPGKNKTVTFRYFISNEFNEEEIILDIIAQEKYKKFGFQETKYVPVNNKNLESNKIQHNELDSIQYESEVSLETVFQEKSQSVNNNSINHIWREYDDCDDIETSEKISYANDIIKHVMNTLVCSKSDAIYFIGLIENRVDKIQKNISEIASQNTKVNLKNILIQNTVNDLFFGPSSWIQVSSLHRNSLSTYYIKEYLERLSKLSMNSYINVELYFERDYLTLGRLYPCEHYEYGNVFEFNISRWQILSGVPGDSISYEDATLKVLSFIFYKSKRSSHWNLSVKNIAAKETVNGE